MRGMELFMRRFVALSWPEEIAGEIIAWRQAEENQHAISAIRQSQHVR